MAWKEEAATNLKIRFESMTMAILNDVRHHNDGEYGSDIPKLMKQLNSIRRKSTQHGNFVFDVEKNKEHHGDRAWALALASSMGVRPKRNVAIEIPSQLLKIKDDAIAALMKRMVASSDGGKSGINGIDFGGLGLDFKSGRGIGDIGLPEVDVRGMFDIGGLL